jgi:hypothetical protein
MMSPLFWDVIPHSLVAGQYFEKNTGKLLPDYTASHFRRQYNSDYQIVSVYLNECISVGQKHKIYYVSHTYHNLYGKYHKTNNSPI